MGSTSKSGDKEMSVAEIKEKRNGRPTIKEIPLPEEYIARLDEIE